MPSVLITTEVLRDAPGAHVDQLAAAGYDVRFPAKSVLLTENDVLEAAQGFVAIIAGSEPYTDRVLAELPALRIISRNGVGYDQIDVPAATRRGIAVTITPEGNYQAVAEHTLALLLAVARRVVSNAVDTRNGNWRRRGISIPLRGKTLGIVGLGRIGRSVACAPRRSACGCSRTKRPPIASSPKRYGVELVELDTLLAQSDFVTLHAPMTPRDAGTDQCADPATHEARQRAGQHVARRAGERSGFAGGIDQRPSGRRGTRRPAPSSRRQRIIRSWLWTTSSSAPTSRRWTRKRSRTWRRARRKIFSIYSAGNWPLASLINPDVQAVWKV